MHELKLVLNIYESKTTRNLKVCLQNCLWLKNGTNKIIVQEVLLELEFYMFLVESLQ